MKILVCWESETLDGRLITGHCVVTVSALDGETINEISQEIFDQRATILRKPDTDTPGVILRSITRLDE